MKKEDKVFHFLVVNVWNLFPSGSRWTRPHRACPAAAGTTAPTRSSAGGPNTARPRRGTPTAAAATAAAAATDGPRPRRFQGFKSQQLPTLRVNGYDTQAAFCCKSHFHGFVCILSQRRRPFSTHWVLSSSVFLSSFLSFSSWEISSNSCKNPLLIWDFYGFSSSHS